MCTLSYNVAHRQTRKSGNLVTFHPCRWTLSSFFSSYTPSLASFPGSPHARTKSGKERGEPGKIYHVRNVIGRENSITCGRTNEHTHALLTIYSFSRESFMADRTGLDSTMLHYLAVQRVMVSVNRPVPLKIMLTYLLT